MSSSAVERSFPSSFAVATPEGAEGGDWEMIGV